MSIETEGSINLNTAAVLALAASVERERLDDSAPGLSRHDREEKARDNVERRMSHFRQFVLSDEV